MPIDLHLHSTHSDGTLTPAEIIAMAKSLGLTAVALTDHNTVSGLWDFLNEAEKQGVTAVAGTELSTVYKGQEIHLLGLFIPTEAFAAVTALTEDYLTRKEQSNRDLVARLAADAGDYEDASRYAGGDDRRMAHMVDDCARQVFELSGKAESDAEEE